MLMRNGEQWLNESTQGDDGNASLSAHSSRLTPNSTIDPEEQGAPDVEPPNTTSNWFSALTASKSGKSKDAATTQDAATTLDDIEADLSNLQWAQDTSETAHTEKPITNRQSSSTLKKALSQSAAKSKPSRVTPSADEATTNKTTPKKPWVLWGASLLLGIAIVWGVLAIGRLFQSAPSNSETPDVAPSTSVAPDSADSDLSETAPENTSSETNEGTPGKTDDLTSDGAQEIIRAWQKIKSESMGKSYQKEALSQILIGAELDDWERRVDRNQEEGIYTTFDLKNITVESVSKDNDTEAVVRAKVEESRDEYWGDASEPRVSLDDAYQVDYRLELIDGKWKIKAPKFSNLKCISCI